MNLFSNLCLEKYMLQQAEDILSHIIFCSFNRLNQM